MVLFKIWGVGIGCGQLYPQAGKLLILAQELDGSEEI